MAGRYYDPPNYVIVWSEQTHRPLIAHAVSVSQPMTRTQAQAALLQAQVYQSSGQGEQYRARILPIGDPFGIGVPEVP